MVPFKPNVQYTTVCWYDLVPVWRVHPIYNSVFVWIVTILRIMYHISMCICFTWYHFHFIPIFNSMLLWFETILKIISYIPQSVCLTWCHVNKNIPYSRVLVRIFWKFQNVKKTLKHTKAKISNIQNTANKGNSEKKWISKNKNTNNDIFERKQ